MHSQKKKKDLNLSLIFKTINCYKLNNLSPVTSTENHNLAACIK